MQQTQWTNDIKRMKKAGVPKRRSGHKKKWEMAIESLKKIKDKVPHECTIFDAGYGELRPFLKELDRMREKFIGRIPCTHTFWPIDVRLNRKKKSKGRPRIYPEVYQKSVRPIKAKDWAKKLEKTPKKWQVIELPLQKRKTVRATRIRVFEANSKAYWRPGIERWLIIENDGEEQKYYVSSFPKNISLKKMIHTIHRRWTIEQGYQQLKEELGLDHFEGRSWRGLHHHMTLTFMAYCFLQLIKNRKGKKRGKKLHASSNQAMDSGSSYRSTMPGLPSLDYNAALDIFCPGLAQCYLTE